MQHSGTAAAYFAAGYGAARGKFRDAVRAAGGSVWTLPNPAPAPTPAAAAALGLAPAEDGPLSTDATWFGPENARRLLLALSGTHGVEGFCGSGIQVGWLSSGRQRDLAPDTAMLLVHAINPHGFAWQRRVTEDNVDLNRNFVDHARPYPVNAGYERLRDAICPVAWTDDARTAADATLADYGAKHGAMALQAAISSGQYSHAAGVFYGGTGKTWSHRTLAAILDRLGRQARSVAFIDLHTGLGPCGFGEIMNNHATGEASFERVSDWYGGEATSTEAGSSSSAPIHGDITNGVVEALRHVDIAGITLEYGTVPLDDVLAAVRADNWLHAHGDLGSAEGRAIKAEIRRAFYPDTDAWKEQVFERAQDVLDRALRGLARD